MEAFYLFCLVLRDFPLGLSPWTYVVFLVVALT